MATNEFTYLSPECTRRLHTDCYNMRICRSAAERGEATSRGSMYFTHSTAIHATLARLGLLKDSNRLVAASYDKAKHGRRWDISQNAPFAANLAAVLYE